MSNLNQKINNMVNDIQQLSDHDVAELYGVVLLEDGKVKDLCGDYIYNSLHEWAEGLVSEGDYPTEDQLFEIQEFYRSF